METKKQSIQTKYKMHFNRPYDSFNQSPVSTRKQFSSDLKMSKTTYFQQLSNSSRAIKPSIIKNPQFQHISITKDNNYNIIWDKTPERVRCKSLSDENFLSQSPQKEKIFRICSDVQKAPKISAPFVEKFCWKAIPQNLQVKSQRKISQETSSSSFLKVEKNYLFETKVSTNGINSLQASKYIHNSSSHNQKNSSNICENNNNLDQKLMDQINLFSLFKNYKEKNKLQNCEIQQIQSLSHSRISHISDSIQQKNLILDQSIVEWTYQTGFKECQTSFQLQIPK